MAAVPGPVSAEVSETAQVLPWLRSTAKCWCRSFSRGMDQVADTPKPAHPAHSSRSLERNRRCDPQRDRSEPAGLTNYQVQSGMRSPIRNPDSWLDRKQVMAHPVV